MSGNFNNSVARYGVLLMLTILMTACSDKNKSQALLSIPVKSFNLIDKSTYNNRIKILEKSKTGVVNLHAILSELFYIDKARDSIITINKLKHETLNVYTGTIIFDNVPDDDSVSGYRYDVNFQRKQGVLEISEVKYSWRCWEGRGHRDFGNKPCS